MAVTHYIILQINSHLTILQIDANLTILQINAHLSIFQIRTHLTIRQLSAHLTMRQLNAHLTIWLIKTNLKSTYQLKIIQYTNNSSKKLYYLSEGFALTGYDTPGCVEDGAWMLQENSSVVVAAVAHPDFENGHFLRFITESELPECADRSVSSKRVPRKQCLRKVVVGKNKISKKSRTSIKNGKNGHSIKIPYRNIPHSYPLKGAVMYQYDCITTLVVCQGWTTQ